MKTARALSGHSWRLGTPAQPRVEGGRFTVERGGATLTGLVVAPANAELHPEPNALRVWGGPCGSSATNRRLRRVSFGVPDGGQSLGGFGYGQRLRAAPSPIRVHRCPSVVLPPPLL